MGNILGTNKKSIITIIAILLFLFLPGCFSRITGLASGGKDAATAKIPQDSKKSDAKPAEVKVGKAPNAGNEASPAVDSPKSVSNDSLSNKDASPTNKAENSEKKKSSVDTDSERLPDPEADPWSTPIKKHDHSKYVTALRNKAIDLLNREENVYYARLCKDFATDQWSFTIYYKQQTIFSFIIYTWDEIDQKWVKSLTSDKRPMARFQKHLNFYTAGKECQILKGGNSTDR
jgi:hypothetical protein